MFLGTLVLVIGWYGFNVDSSTALWDPSTGEWISALVAANMAMCMFGPTLTAAMSKFDPLWTANGILAGAMTVQSTPELT